MRCQQAQRNTSLRSGTPSCSGTFTSSCTVAPPYDFNFNFNLNPPNMIAPANLNLPAGSSYDYLFGSFDPTGGTAPVGTYQFFFSSLFIVAGHQKT